MLDDEKSIFFDIILQNLEDQIQRANKVSPTRPDQSKMFLNLPFVDLMAQMKQDKLNG